MLSQQPLHNANIHILFIGCGKNTTFEPIQWVDVALVLQHDLLDGPLPPLVDLSGLFSLLVVADRDG